MNTEKAVETVEQLQEETAKWQEKLENRLETVETTGPDGDDLLENARAYAQDVDHFKQDGDWVRAFEAVVWGWSWLEIGERLELLE